MTSPDPSLCSLPYWGGMGRGEREVSGSSTPTSTLLLTGEGE